MSEHDISDELLTAFLDGELAADDHARVEKALADSADLQARLAQLDVPLAPLRAALEPLLSQAPGHLLPDMTPAKRPFPVAISGCALAAGLALGAIFLPQLTSTPKSPGWIDYVASYQALYSTATLEGVSLSAPEQAAQLETVSTAVGRPLGNAHSVPGMDFKRAQVLGFRGKPLVQLAYLTPEGVPMALCVISKSETATLRQMELEGLRSATWSDGSHAYLLIGGMDAAVIERAAAHLQKNL